jgi:hypothetical protein
MDVARVQASLHAAELCLAHGLSDSAVHRAYFVTLCSSSYVDGNSSQAGHWPIYCQRDVQLRVWRRNGQ